MATVIKRPLVGDHPRRVMPGVSSIEGSTKEQTKQNDTLPQNATNTLASQVTEHEAKSYDETKNNLLEPNPLAEALKLANKRAEEAELNLKNLSAALEKKKEEAVEEGYKDGHDKGLEQGLVEYSDRIKILEEIAKGLNKRVDEIMVEAENMAVELAYAAVGKILSGQLTKREAVESIVQNQVERLACDPREMVVHLSPDDLKLLTDPVGNQSQLPDGIRLVADDRIKFGGCIIEANSGNLDARLEVQLNELLELFANVRRNGQEAAN